MLSFLFMKWLWCTKKVVHSLFLSVWNEKNSGNVLVPCGGAKKHSGSKGNLEKERLTRKVVGRVGISFRNGKTLLNLSARGKTWNCYSWLKASENKLKCQKRHQINLWLNQDEISVSHTRVRLIRLMSPLDKRIAKADRMSTYTKNNELVW